MTLKLQAQPRLRRGKQSNQLRAQGWLPVIMYGHRQKSEALTVRFGQFERLWQKAHGTTMIDLEIEGRRPSQVLIHDIQLHPVTNRIIHADLYQVKLTEKIKTTIPIQVVGEAPAAKELQGTLITTKNEVEVEALPQNLVPAIEVDISGLRTFEDVIQIQDLKIPPGLALLDQPEEVVVLVQPPRSEEELAELKQKPVEDVESVAVEERGKAEEVGEAKPDSQPTPPEKIES